MRSAQPPHSFQPPMLSQPMCFQQSHPSGHRGGVDSAWCHEPCLFQGAWHSGTCSARSCRPAVCASGACSCSAMCLAAEALRNRMPHVYPRVCCCSHTHAAHPSPLPMQHMPRALVDIVWFSVCLAGSMYALQDCTLRLRPYHACHDPPMLYHPAMLVYPPAIGWAAFSL